MESLRLFSFGVNGRVAENDDYIDDVFVPKGTAVIIPVRRPSFFKRLSVISVVVGSLECSYKHLGRRCRQVTPIILILFYRSYLSIIRFNPARWLDSTKKLKTSPPLLSFLTGPHRCIAKVMAIIQMKIVLSYVNFRLDENRNFRLFYIDHSLQTSSLSQLMKVNTFKELRCVSGLSSS